MPQHRKKGRKALEGFGVSPVAVVRIREAGQPLQRGSEHVACV